LPAGMEKILLNTTKVPLAQSSYFMGTVVAAAV
jgi:hypothetical protein